ncbi:MAG: undecaprenyl/decaprenyl-phosphate alpha-N-acetylglucosaminyl 1-phosphate transferase [Clostridiales Family XIII bacterium]|jgi:UDP-GlcNAc:undecaprenyl-phosphate GlcNAc-1-phosphate transferase|nr:undecaprenyl/decaprenyl-phosphate alpha-N-acetylglucosaminyl 1-phosphate transferase [Clostridiales Family XIII bacterium]
MTQYAIISLSAFCCIVLAFVISLGAAPLSILIAKRANVLDVPTDERRMHSRPIPRLGGIAIFISFFVCTLILRQLIQYGYFWEANADEMLGKLTAVLVSGALIFVLGVIDDIKNIRAHYKLAFQIGIAAVAFALGIRIPQIAVFGWHFADNSAGGAFVSFIVTVIWIVAITNMINLIDGLDGLAAGVSGIAALAIAYTAYINGYYTAAFAMAILAGSTLGFLPFNFYPAKVFMGDCGAMFLGFMIASVSIISPAKSATIVAIIAPVIVLGVPAFDTAFAMIRRKIRGKSMFEADKGHLHHQLTRIGIGQRRSALILYGISGIMGIAAIVFSRALYLEAIGLFLIAILFIIVLIWGWDKHSD